MDTILPSAPLADSVDALWHRRACHSAERYLVLPDGCMDLVLRRSADGRMSALSFGPTTSYQRVTLDAGTTYAGVRLRPWIGAPAFERAGLELLNQVGIRCVSPVLDESRSGERDWARGCARSFS